MNHYDKYKVDVPEGISGDWKIEKVTVTPENEKLERLRALSHGGRFTPAGTFTRLLRNGHTIMSDTPDEIRDIRMAIHYATGEVLINGLGLGVVLNAILQKPTVTHVTVIEQSQDVINLVGEHYRAKYGDRLEIICADALTWTPPKGKRYNVVWHDIWDDICTDNLLEMTKLHRKYGRRADWQGSWCKELCQRYKRLGEI